MSPKANCCWVFLVKRISKINKYFFLGDISCCWHRQQRVHQYPRDDRVPGVRLWRDYRVSGTAALQSEFKGDSVTRFLNFFSGESYTSSLIAWGLLVYNIFDFSKVFKSITTLGDSSVSFKPNRLPLPKGNTSTRRSRFYLNHRKLDLQRLFGLHVLSCTHWLRPRTHPPPPASGLLYEAR